MTICRSDQQTPKVVLITGASSGIGAATARLLAHQGLHVVLGARRINRLETLVSEIRASGGLAEYCALDVTHLEAVRAFVSFAKEKFGRIDVIVNNAGVMPLSKLERLNIDNWNYMIDVNIRGVLHGIAAGLPLMKQQQSGQFINISSVAGHVVFPSAAVYCATKFAVRAISEGLRQEVGDTIRVTVISPGTTQSELANTILDDAVKQDIENLMQQIAIPAAAIARAIAFAIEQPDDVDVSEIIVRPTANPY